MWNDECVWCAAPAVAVAPLVADDCVLATNTSVLSVLTGSVLRRLARMTGITLTWFWGWGRTLIPRPNKIVRLGESAASGVAEGRGCRTSIYVTSS